MLPIAAEGWGFILVPLVLAAPLWPGPAGRRRLSCSAWSPPSWPSSSVTPTRAAPPVPRSDPGAGGRPGDGRPRRPWTTRSSGAAQAVSIFLSPLDVHVNRSPLAGLVVGVEYRPGAKLAGVPAPRPRSRTSARRIAIQGEAARVVVRQIAGVLARRIVCRVRPGDKLASGERFGLIKFGSRTDLIVPASVRLRVKVGRSRPRRRDRDGGAPVRRRPRPSGGGAGPSSASAGGRRSSSCPGSSRRGTSSAGSTRSC